MAKKEAKEMSVEQKLQALYELQTTLTAIDEKRALRGELPLEVQDLEDEIAGLDTRIEKIDTEIKEFQSAITMKKGEVQEAQANLERYNNQLNEVRNNREYDSLSKQIDYERLEVELCNKKIKEATDQVAYRTNDLEIAKTERESVRRILTRKRANWRISWRRPARRRPCSRSVPRTWKSRSSRASSVPSSASARVRATDWVSSMCSVTPVVAASIRFHPSVSSTSRCTRRSSSVSIVDASWSIRSWLASRWRTERLKSRSASAVPAARLTPRRRRKHKASSAYNPYTPT